MSISRWRSIFSVSCSPNLKYLCRFSRYLYTDWNECVSFSGSSLLNPTDSRPPGSNFNLKVQVNDVLSRQQLSRAFVEIYVNYTRTHTVATGEDGGVLLYVPHQAGASVTIVASRDGYISAQLPYKTNRLPSKIFIMFTRLMSTLSGRVMTEWSSSVG